MGDKSFLGLLVESGRNLLGEDFSGWSASPMPAFDFSVLSFCLLYSSVFWKAACFLASSSSLFFFFNSPCSGLLFPLPLFLGFQVLFLAFHSGEELFFVSLPSLVGLICNVTLLELGDLHIFC